MSPPVTKDAATTEANATIEPEDKSIPVVIIAKVTPIAIIPNMDTCSIILQTVRAEKNPSIETDNNKNNAIRINTIPYAFIIFFKVICDINTYLFVVFKQILCLFLLIRRQP